MKSILLVVLFFLSLAFAQQTGVPSAQWSGSNLGVNTTWNQPTYYSSDGSCSNTTTGNYSYVVFNITFNTTAVRQVLAMSENVDFYVFVYNGTFNATQSETCVNLQQQLGSTTYTYAYGPQIDDFFLFWANRTYYFVVSSSTGAQFALNVFDPIATGSNIGNPTWQPITFTSETECETTSSSYTAPYASFTWTQSTTGLFEVVGGFSENYTADIGQTYLAVFQGNLTNAQLNTADLCSSTSIVVVNAYNEGERSVRLYGLALVAGQTYTAVLSGYDTDEFSNYGFLVYPTRLQLANFLATGFSQPDNSSTGCTPDDIYTNNSWTAASFPAPFSNALFAASELSSSNPSNFTSLTPAAWVYTGNNLGSSTTAPSSCTGLYAISDTQGVFAILTTPHQNYTIVVSYYYEGSGQPTDGTTAVFLVFALTGTPVGSLSNNLPPATTTGGQTNTITGGSGIATGTHGTIGNTSTSTTAAGIALVSSPFVFVLVALFALMF